MDAKEEQTWGMLTHLTALSGLIGVPTGHLVGPLIVWLIKKDESEVVDAQGKESLNFQISMTIYAVVAGILCFVLIGIPILIGLWIADIVLVIMASLKANNGEPFKYPGTIRFIK